MTSFLIPASILIVLTLLFLLRPLLRKDGNRGNDTLHSEINLAILRDQLAELEKEKAEGSLDEADFAQAREELQRRLLEETGAEVTAPREPARDNRKTIIALLILLPLAAGIGYAWLGSPRALDPQARAPRQEMTPEMITAMVSKLEAKLQANPEDTQGWLMLARSYKVMGRYTDAARAYSKAEAAMGDDPSALTDYAETLLMAENKGFRGKPAKLIAQALKADPQHPHALLLAGAAAMEGGQAELAANIWEKLLPMVEPGSEVEAMLKQSIEKARSPRK